MSKQNKIRLLLDLSTFIALLTVSAPRFTGDAIHEWLGIALSGAIVVHLLLNWKWIVEVTSRLFTKSMKNLSLGYFLNWGLFISGVMTVLSGLMISKTVVPFFGLTLPQNISWRELHSLSTNIIMVLMGLHVALHWNWIVNMFKKLIPVQRPVSPVAHPKPVLSLQGKEVRS